MSSVSDTFTYQEDAESVWRAAVHFVAAMGYTVYERDDVKRQLLCRTPAASMKRSAGQVIKIIVTPLGQEKAHLAVLVTSYDERKERLVGRRLLQQPRKELIYEVTRGIARLLPVVRPQVAAPSQGGESYLSGTRPEQDRSAASLAAIGKVTDM